MARNSTLEAANSVRTGSDSSPHTSTDRPLIDGSSIAALAYRLWQERGCPGGSDQEDWFNAENELKTQADSDISTTSATR